MKSKARRLLSSNIQELAKSDNHLNDSAAKSEESFGIILTLRTCEAAVGDVSKDEGECTRWLSWSPNGKW